MYYELALISVLVAGAYWGWFFVRTESLRTYGVMQLAAAALAGLGLLGRHYDDEALGIGGAIGVGAGACLLVLGPIARGLARRAAASERFGLAQRLLDIADVLAPGSGVGDEKALVGAMRELRDGNIERTVDALVAAKDRAPAEARLAIDERIAMLYLAAYRWDEAIAHAEAHLFDALPAGPATSPQQPLRRILGVAPPVWVELLGAYGYKGDLDRAASMLARLEEACAGREDGQIWLHRGRMMFLALAGRVDAVQALVEPRRSRHMSPAARTYWIAVAHERRGDSAAAGAAYARARARSRGRPRVLIDQALARLENPQPIAVNSELSDVIARVEAAEPPQVAARPRAHGPIATRVLIALVIGVAIAIAIAFGEASDLGVIVRAGAMVRPLVRDGEWWRLVSCMFVHIDGVHLLGNALMLWFLGRLAEELFGSWRTAAVFGLAGIAGAFASLYASPASISAGASGAIFGLLGAVLVELTWQRKRHRAAWTSRVWSILAIVAVAQIGIDFVEPMTDQWAHGGGLAAGALLGFVLSPHARWGRVAHHAARAIALALAGVALAAGVLVAGTTTADSLMRAPLKLFVVHDIGVTAPASWVIDKDGALTSPATLVAIDLVRRDLDPAYAIDDLAEHELKAQQPGDRAEAAPDQLLALPAGWRGRELVHTVTDALDQHRRARVLIAARTAPGGSIVARIVLPETYARWQPELFLPLLSSVAFE
jgi:rhomboid protease GluP